METIFLFIIGFLIGIRHAFDADHIVAINLLLSKTKTIYKTLKIGLFWGLGHTITLLITGLIIIILNINVSNTNSKYLELLVGIMLIFLGIGTFHKKLEKNLSKINSTKKSLSIGAIHGLAGSGALMLLLIPQIENTFEAIIYITIFGIGTLIGMLLISSILFYSLKLIKHKTIITYSAGVISIIAGILILINTLLN